MSELVKLLTCLVIVYINEGSLRHFINTIDATIVKQPYDTLKVCVPSLVYIIQNNLLYISASNLDAATYQVTESKFKLHFNPLTVFVHYSGHDFEF